MHWSIYQLIAVLLLVACSQTQGAQRRGGTLSFETSPDGDSAPLETGAGPSGGGRRRKGTRRKEGSDGVKGERRSGKRRRKKGSSMEPPVDTSVEMEFDMPTIDLPVGAIETVDTALDNDALAERGYNLLGKGDIPSAIEAFKQTRDHYGLSLCYTSGPLRDYELALHHATESLKENPSIPALYFQRSRVLGFMGRMEELTADTHALLGLGVETEMLVGHAESFKAAQHCTSALRIYDVLLDMTVDEAKTASYYVAMAACRDELGDVPAAYDLLSKAIALNPSGVDPVHSSKIAKYLIELGDTESATKLCLSIISAMENELSTLNQWDHSPRISELEHALSRHLRVAAVVFQELGLPATTTELSKKISFGGGVDFVSAVIAIDSYQAIGDFPAAIELADTMLRHATQSDLRGLFRFRREVAYVNYCALDLPFSAYSIDTLVDTRIKYARTKIFGLESEFVPMESYTDAWQQCAQKKLAHQSVYGKPELPYDFVALTAQVKNLSDITTKIRSILQLNATGFYMHKRKDRMMGFSALAMNQMLRRHVRCILGGHDGLYVSNAAASSSDMIEPSRVGTVYMAGLSYPSTCAKGTTNGDAIHSLLHPFAWRDMFDIGVKWRQLAEPTDPVWWMDRFEEFSGDKGNDTVSTPLMTGQNKVRRYYTYFNETLALFKKAMRQCHYAEGSECMKLSSTEKAAVDRASSLSDLYAFSGQTDADIYVIANCTSAAYPDRAYPCTKLSLSPARGRGEGWEYRISAAHSTAVYAQYFSDLDILFQRYVNKLVEIYSTEDAERRVALIERVADDIFDILYTWVHCSPLSRGSASLAYTAGMAMFLAADMCLEGSFPPNKQLDWEVLVSTTPRDFKARVRPWFDGIRKQPVSSACPEFTPQWLEGVSRGPHSIEDLFPSARHVLAALSVDV